MTQSSRTHTACAILDLRKRTEDRARLEPRLCHPNCNLSPSWQQTHARPRDACHERRKRLVIINARRPRSAGSRHGAQTPTTRSKVSSPQQRRRPVCASSALAAVAAAPNNNNAPTTASFRVAGNGDIPRTEADDAA